MPDRSRCPNCGSRVSPYAAGCAQCGADLDFHRWDSGPTAARRVASALSALSFGAIPMWLLVAAVVVALVLVLG